MNSLFIFRYIETNIWFWGMLGYCVFHNGMVYRFLSMYFGAIKKHEADEAFLHHNSQCVLGISMFAEAKVITWDSIIKNNFNDKKPIVKCDHYLLSQPTYKPNNSLNPLTEFCIKTVPKILTGFFQPDTYPLRFSNLIKAFSPS